MADYPIENKDNDKLRRTALAKKVAELVANYEGQESFVVGIEGQWGSGKTSFINLALNEIKDDPNLVVIHFNPWNFTGQNELIADFFSALLEELEGKVDKDVVKTIQSYAGKLQQVSYSPKFSTPFGEFGFGEFSKNNKESLQKQRQKIDKTLKEIDKKIIVVIDDTDRLDAEETKLIMKLVKMTANFPNVVFVLAYDREQVAKKIGEDGVGEEYLKKIIQVSFTLPVADELGLRGILFNDLEDTIKTVYEVQEVKFENSDEKRWNDLVYKGVHKPFKTIRDIKRFISSLRLNWSIVEKQDINQIDFIAIEIIRVFAPTLYSGIAANQSLFTAPFGFSDYGDQTKKNLQLKFKELIDVLPKDLQKPMEGICEVLFPHLDNASYGRDWSQQWKRERRICADERFKFYFQLGIPDGGISEVEVNHLLEGLSDKKAFSERVVELAKDGRLRLMLTKILDRVDTLNEEQVKALVSALWDLEKEITDEREEVFDFDDIPTQVSRITYHSIKNLPPEDRFSVLEELITKTKAFYTPTHFVAILNDQQNKAQQTEPELITKEEAEKLKLLSAKNINTLADGNLLHNEAQFIFALYRWKEWEGEEKVKEYIKKLISTREGLFSFLRGFVRKVLSTTGNYKDIDKSVIGALYPIDVIETLVKEIKDEEVELMTEKDKEAILLFKSPSRKDW